MSWIFFLSIVGIAFICLELFLPGIVLGVLGVLCLVAAVTLTYIMYGASRGHIASAALLIGSAVVLALWIILFPKSKRGKMMITERTLADSKSADTLDSLYGKNGKAITPLRPSGIATIDHHRIDVIAESGLIDQETPILVTRVEGNRVFVRKL